MLAQVGAFVLRPEQAAPLQDRHDAVDESFQAAGKGRRHQHETVGRPFGEPALERIRDFLRRADEPVVAEGTGKQGVDFAERRVISRDDGPVFAVIGFVQLQPVQSRVFGPVVQGQASKSTPGK